MSVNNQYNDELGALADTLNTMAAKIHQNEKFKNDLISSVSHELRTPLTSIKGWVVTLHASVGDNQDMLNEGLEIIDSETDRLTQMVDELLDFSKLDNGRIQLSCKPVNLQQLLLHIGKQLTPRAARQSISLVVEVEETLPIIQADENRLKQVLINLIDNSLKFTGSGGRISMYVYSNKQQVIITVEDTGSGIMEKDLANVLQKFYKGNSHAAGSGLGLPISEQIIKLHQGQLFITSVVGEGTKVEIYLPK
ncbi:Alkaline phosphatase synthesis sensor protein PhoR [compost metagenome]